MSERVEPVPFVTVVVQQKGEDNDAPQPVRVEVDPSKFRFLLPQLQDAAHAEQFVNTGEVIADLSEAAVGAELAADIAVMMDVSEGRTAVDSVRIAAQTLRGADYVQLPEELYLEQVVSYFLQCLLRVDSTTPSVTATPAEVVPCVHTGQLMWDRLGAYNVLRLEQMGIISLGHKGVIDATDERIDDELLGLAATMNDVTSLDISGNEHITQCDAFAETLVTLVLHSCYNFPDASIQRVAKYGRLQHLSVGGAPNISDASMMVVAQNCTMLQHLDVCYTKGVVTDTFISLIAQHCSQLRHLNVKNISARCILVVASNCRQLEYLDLSECPDVTDAALIAVAEHCTQLKELYVAYIGSITDASIIKVAENCPQLIHLSLCGSNNDSKITDAAITAIAKNCNKLEVLNIGAQRNITDVSILEIARCCARLTSLDIHCTQGRITNESLKHLPSGCEVYMED